MKYPDLVNKDFCINPITVTLFYTDINEDGAPTQIPEITAKCMLKNGAGKRVYDDKGIEVQINLVAYIPGDIAPQLPFITGGNAIVNAHENMRIISGSKICNPDGSVNYTRLELV